MKQFINLMNKFGVDEEQENVDVVQVNANDYDSVQEDENTSEIKLIMKTKARSSAQIQ